MNDKGNTLLGARPKIIGVRSNWATRLLPLFLLFTLPAEMKAQFNYLINTDFTVTITGYTGPANDVATVPTTISGLPVTSIGNSAFSYSALAGITIPESVTSMGAAAFFWCTSLTNVTMANGITNIGDNAFADCGRLTHVTISQSLTTIGSGLFSGTGLTSVTIPDSVTSIGTSAFYSCHSLTNVDIGKSVTNIASDAFRSTGLTSFTVDPLNSAYSSLDGVLFDKSRKTLIMYPLYKFGAYVIPNGVTSIGPIAFLGVSLTSVTIPDTVISIGASAFQTCYGLTNVTLGNGLNTIGYHAFDSCAGLANLKIPDSVGSIAQGAFYQAGLTSITIPDNVTSIERGAFSYCMRLTNVDIESSVIGDAAFDYCSSVTNITLGKEGRLDWERCVQFLH